MITKDVVTQVANYLKINTYQLFFDAFKWSEDSEDDTRVRVDYDEFVNHQLVPQYVYEYCELTLEGI